MKPPKHRNTLSLRQMRHRSAFLATALIAAVSGLSACETDSGDQVKHAASLEEALPVLEELQIFSAENQNSCTLISYRRGVYADTAGADCETTFEEAEPLDSKAVTDLDRLLKVAGGDTFRSVMNVSYGPDGTVLGATFEAYGDSYIFTADGSTPAIAVNELDSRRINERWYFVHPDWN